MTHKKIPSGSQYYQQSEKVKKLKHWAPEYPSTEVHREEEKEEMNHLISSCLRKTARTVGPNPRLAYPQTDRTCTCTAPSRFWTAGTET